MAQIGSTWGSTKNLSTTGAEKHGCGTQIMRGKTKGSHNQARIPHGGIHSIAFLARFGQGARVRIATLR
jgi:hypothetical protein